MRPFSLTANLLTGIPALDEQHGELFDLANEVVDAPEGDVHPELFALALTFLAGYVAYHFATEEMVMSELGYPQSSTHAGMHAQLQRNVATLVAKARRVGATREMKAEMALLLNDWIVHHVRERDGEMARFVRELDLDVQNLSLPGVLVLKSRGAIPADFDEGIADGMAGLRRRAG